MRAICWLALTLWCVQSAQGQASTGDEFDARTKRGVDYIYNLEFEKADQEFRELVKMRPRHPAGHFFLAMVQWWRILIDIDNEQYDDQFHKALDDVIDLCDELLDENEGDITALFFKGGSIGFKGRLQAHRSEWLAAANAGRRALPIVREASALDPDNYDILLGTGIYNYYAAVIPDQYPFVKPLLLFIPPGDRQKGIQQLTSASQRGKYAAIEATYFLMQLYYLHEKNYGMALSYALTLNERFPNNVLFHKYLGRCYAALSNWVHVEKVCSDIVERVHAGRRGYNEEAEREAQYYLGSAAMSTGKHTDALPHFWRCDELSRKLDKKEPSGFMIMANLKAGQVYDLLSKRDLAVSQYRKVLAMREYRDSYKQAEQFLKTPFAQ